MKIIDYLKQQGWKWQYTDLDDKGTILLVWSIMPLPGEATYTIVLTFPNFLTTFFLAKSVFNRYTYRYLLLYILYILHKKLKYHDSPYN